MSSSPIDRSNYLYRSASLPHVGTQHLNHGRVVPFGIHSDPFQGINAPKAHESAALDAFAEFSEKWEKKYPAIIRLWTSALPLKLPQSLTAEVEPIKLHNDRSLTGSPAAGCRVAEPRRVVLTRSRVRVRNQGMTEDGVRVLREFLYMDSDKVSALLGQLSDGVPEEARDTNRSAHSTGGGAKGFAWHQADRTDETQVQRSLADSNFPELERILESENILVDLSDVLVDAPAWTESEWRNATPPGSLVRITLGGWLFDARYVTQLLAGFGSVMAGAQGLNVMPGKPGTRTQEKQGRAPEPQIEDTIPLFAVVDDGQGQKIGREYLQAVVRIAKGLFSPGLHLILMPADNTEFAVTARLEEGRRYLDTSPEILFARYGALFKTPCN